MPVTPLTALDRSTKPPPVTVACAAQLRHRRPNWGGTALIGGTPVAFASNVAVERVLPFLDFVECYATADARELAFTLRTPGTEVWATVFPDPEQPNRAAFQAWMHWIRGGDGLVVWSARELAALIGARAEINGGPLLHLAGDSLTPGFTDELQRLGFHVLQPIVYTTRAATRLSSAIVAHMRNGRIDGVVLLSPRTSAVYVRLVARHKLEAACRKLTHYCLSAAVAAALGSLEVARTAIAAQPNLQELLALTAAGAAQSAKP